MSYKIVYACGAYQTTQIKPERNKAGNWRDRLVYVSRDGYFEARPRIPGKKDENLRAHCLLMCPSTARKSHRKVNEGWIGETEEEAMKIGVTKCVFFRPVEVQLIEPK